VTFRTNLVDVINKGTAGTGDNSNQVQSNNYLSTGCIKNNAAGPMDVGNNYQPGEYSIIIYDGLPSTETVSFTVSWAVNVEAILKANL